MKYIKTFVGKFFIFPSFRETNFELVIGLALAGSGDVGAVTLRTGEWISFIFSFSAILSECSIGDSGTLRSSSSKECSNCTLIKSFTTSSIVVGIKFRNIYNLMIYSLFSFKKKIC